MHGGDVNLYRQFSKIYRLIMVISLKNADYVIVNSKDIQEKVFNICNRKDIFVISPGVDTRIFRSIPENENPYFKKLNLCPDQLVISFVGNAIERKGIKTYLEALDLSKNYF